MHPGILPTEVNTELANTSGKMGRKLASCALSGLAALSPMKAHQDEAVTEKQRDETGADGGCEAVVEAEADGRADDGHH